MGLFGRRGRGGKMAKKDSKKDGCYCNGAKKFPTLPVIVLVLGILWLLSDLNILKINIPWLPIVLIIAAIGWIINSYWEKE